MIGVGTFVGVARKVVHVGIFVKVWAVEYVGAVCTRAVIGPVDTIIRKHKEGE